MVEKTLVICGLEDVSHGDFGEYSIDIGGTELRSCAAPVAGVEGALALLHFTERV